MNYVCGFAFSKNKERVALILKNRPAFLAGKYNGIGGKIEETDTSVLTAMVREFKEEAGCYTKPSDWYSVGHLWFNKAADKVYFFKAKLEDEIFDTIINQEDETIVLVNTQKAIQQLNLDRHALMFLLACSQDDIGTIDIILND